MRNVFADGHQTPEGWELRKDSAWLDPDSGRWITQQEITWDDGFIKLGPVPAGFNTDFSSHPKWLGFVLGKHSDWDVAALFHDRSYGLAYDKAVGDQLYRMIARGTGVAQWRARLARRGLGIVGWPAWLRHKAARRT